MGKTSNQVRFKKILISIAVVVSLFIIIGALQETIVSKQILNAGFTLTKPIFNRGLAINTIMLFAYYLGLMMNSIMIIIFIGLSVLSVIIIQKKVK